MKDTDYGFVVRRQISKKHIVPAENPTEARNKLEHSINYDDPLEDYTVENTTIIYTGVIKPAYEAKLDGNTLIVTTKNGSASINLTDIVDVLIMEAEEKGE